MPNLNARPSPVRVWLQLFRAPNLFTVPGDPLVGYLMVNNGDVDWTAGAAIGASLCFYAAGLLMNDLADEVEDLRDRPNRPLPSGQVRGRTVILATVVLLVLGLVALAAASVAEQAPRALVTGLVLVAAITVYNFWTKHVVVVGALNMGACRSLSALLGASVGPRAPFALSMAGAPILLIGLYIAAVTNLARHETRSAAPILARILPILPILGAAFGGLMFARVGSQLFPALVIFAIVVIAGVRLLVRLLSPDCPPLPAMIGAHIRLLLPLQAGFCFLGDQYWGDIGPSVAGLLLAAWPVSALVSKRFYAS